MRIVEVKFKEYEVYNSDVHYYRSSFPVESGDEVVVDLEGRGLVVGMICNDHVTDPLCKAFVEGYLVQRVDKSEYQRIITTNVKIANLREDMKKVMDYATDESLPTIRREYIDRLESLTKGKA